MLSLFKQKNNLKDRKEKRMLRFMKERQDIITTTEELKAFCEEISTYPFITVDTEFLREKTYWAQLCLIQIGCCDFAACIDPLSDDLDLEPLFEIFRNKNILKVFHAARQDLEIFYRLMNELPAPLFDTHWCYGLWI